MRQISLAVAALLLALSTPLAAQTVAADRFYLNSGPCIYSSGSGAPSGGATCDTYLDTATGLFYRKDSSLGWVIVTTGVGTTGKLTKWSSTTGALVDSLWTESGTLLSTTATLRLADGSAGTPVVSFTSETNSGIYRNATNQFAFDIAGTAVATVVGTGLTIPLNTGSLIFGSSADGVLAYDTTDTLAMRRTTNGQVFRIYNTFTDASNYERAKIGWQTNTFVVGPESAGTGSARNLDLKAGSNVFIAPGGSDTYVFGTASFNMNTDNVTDIGQTATGRARDIWLGRDFNVGRNIMPITAYLTNLGSLSDKLLAGYMAELWAETLVAQSTMTTIGGRILVSPTNELVADWSPSLATPGAPTITNGGASGATTYKYRIAAVDVVGQTLASSEGQITNAVASLTVSNFNHVVWSSVTGAASYNVYGRTSGAELFMSNTASLSFDDTGAITPSGALPASNTTLATSHWKYNNMAKNDSTYMEANGKVEFFQVQQWSIVAVSTGSKTFTISAAQNGPNDWTSFFVSPRTMTIAGSTGNDGTYTISSSSYNSGTRQTTITVTTTPPSSTADGGITYITVGATDFIYWFVRDRDGTGSDQWNSGDAMLDTGIAGNGFIDVYSVRGVKASSEHGPTIVGNVRNSTTYNDWSPRWAIGNCDGLYGYSGTTWCLALGDNSKSWVKIDDTNGVRIGNAGNVKVSITPAGTATFTGDGNGVTNINGGNIQTGTVTATQIASNTITASQIAAHTITATQIAASTITATEIAASTITANKLSISTLDAVSATVGSVVVGSSGSIRQGQTAYNTGTGWWIGDVSGTPKLSIGNSSDGATWDGTAFRIVRATLAEFKGDSSGATAILLDSSITQLNCSACTNGPYAFFPGSVTSTGGYNTTYYVGSNGSGIQINGTFTSGSAMYAPSGAGTGYYFTSDTTTGIDADSTSRLRLRAGAVHLFWDGTQFFPEANGTKNLGVTGNFRWNNYYYVGSLVNESDARLKKNVQPTPYGMSFLRQLRPIEFEWINPEWNRGTHEGFLAQDVAAIAPTFDAVFYGDDGVANSLDYVKFVGPIVKALQELDARVQALESKIVSLEKNGGK